jgi:hypothetical protein
LSALVCAAAIFTVGCHRNHLTSGYGVAWVTLSDSPGDFTSYIVNVDSLTLTGKNVGVITAVSAIETVDFTKLKTFSELWSTASIPNDTYTSATITMDYTGAVISVMVDGVPQKATVVGSDGAPITTVSITLQFDPNNQFVVTPTYATTFAQRVAVNMDLAASNVVNLATNPATVTVKPFLTIATSPPDNKPIRVRGPLINSCVCVGDYTYTVYVRPFSDEVNALGTLSIFNDANTIYSINGTAYVGVAGLTALSHLSAGSTMTAAFTTLEPTPTPSATAGIFHSIYVVAGSTLEDFYTEGLEGDVIARSGNTLTVRGATLTQNAEELYTYINTPDSQVLLGPGTIVTADDSSNFTGLDYQSISVGQHITARGIYSLSSAGVTILDATGTSSTNTGSVRLQPTQLWGPLVSTSADNLVMNLQTINDWPVSIFNFAGTGVTAAKNSVAATYAVNTGSLALPAGTVAGDALWIDGVIAPFGAAPPDFNATSVNNEASVQVVDGTTMCGQVTQDCVPASLQVYWAKGTATPFATLADDSLTISLSNPNYTSGVIRIGPQSSNLTSLAATPKIVPVPSPATGTPGAAGTAGLPATFLPLFAVGNPVTASEITTTPSSGSTTSTQSTSLAMYHDFASFTAQVTEAMTAANPALQFEATGFYDRSTNTFNATSIDLVL